MKKYDIIVVGGGFSGVCAAISASRKGMKVLLVEKGNCLGGAASLALVMPFMEFWTLIDGKRLYLSRGIFTEVIQRLDENNALEDNKQFFDNEWLKIILNRMVVDAGVEVLFHAAFADLKMDGNKIDTITLLEKSGLVEYKANYYIDTTGDAYVTRQAGFSTRLGREEDNLCQPMTLCFRLGNVDMEKLKIERDKINPLYQEFQRQGKILNPRENILYFRTLSKGVVHFNTTRICKRNALDSYDMTKAEFEAREQVYETFHFLKDNFESFKESTLLFTAPETGIRESAMIDGEYILKVEDILSLKRFDDVIACCNYSIDLHSPDGAGTYHFYFKPGEYCDIPYRCLIPKNAENLLVAGRCISVDHQTQASIRTMPTCATFGQAAGTAAYIAKITNKNVNEIDIDLLKNTLIQDGAFLGE